MSSSFVNSVGLIILLLTVIIFFIFCIKLISFFIKREKFPKNLLTASLAGVVVVVAIRIYTQFFFTFDNRPQGDIFKYPVDSPNKEYTAQAYTIPYGGAAGGVDVRVEILFNDTKTTKTIYFSDVKDEFSLKWTGDHTLYIQNESPKYNVIRSIELNVKNEIYHDTGAACRSILLKDTYQKCYHN